MKSHIIASLISITAALIFSDSAFSQNVPPASNGLSQTSSDKKSARTANRNLAHAVRKSLTKSGKIEMSHISIFANGGHVVLAGSVTDGQQLLLANVLSEKVAGVGNVNNRLSIATSGH